MKKCDFLSPEALLQAEIFGSGSGGGNSSVTDVSSSIGVYTGEGLSTTTVKAFWDSASGSGLYYVKILTNGSLPSISTIDNSIVSISPLFLSSNESATYDSETGKISFSDTTTRENIETYGILYPGSVGTIK